MINSSEIRNGNWFKHLDNWSYRQSDGENKEFNFQWGGSDWYALGECTLFLKDIEPIPLTEELLLKFDLSLKGTDLSVSCGIDSKIIHFVIGNYYKRIYFVHELQNIFFAITGKELTLNEKI